MDVERPIRLGVLLSGGGRTLQNICDHIAAGDLPAEVGLVISSRPEAYGVVRARKLGLPVEIVNKKTTPDETFQNTITEKLKAAKVDLVCMAGFCSFWRVPESFAGRVMNIHPALLPRFGGKGFYGHRVHEAVLASGCRRSGCTVHFCDNQYDHGPVILQRCVPVRPGDTPETLGERVFEQERVAYPEAIRLFAGQQLAINGETVEVLAL